MLGMIATFMEDLHLSYDDVVYKIPYAVLQLMRQDKLHTLYGEYKVPVSDEVAEQYFASKGFKRNKEATRAVRDDNTKTLNDYKSCAIT
jgi:hypothetical protein